MSRDPIYDTMKELSKEKAAHDRHMHLEHARVQDDGGWTKHTEFHWSRTLNGRRLDYWPSKSKFQYRGKVRRGDVHDLIRKETAQPVVSGK